MTNRLEQYRTNRFEQYILNEHERSMTGRYDPSYVLDESGQPMLDWFYQPIEVRNQIRIKVTEQNEKTVIKTLSDEYICDIEDIELRHRGFYCCGLRCNHSRTDCDNIKDYYHKWVILSDICEKDGIEIYLCNGQILAYEQEIEKIRNTKIFRP